MWYNLRARNWIFTGVVITFLFLFVIVSKYAQKKGKSATLTSTTMSLAITSPAFKINGVIPTHFTCDGENISPELNFKNIPTGTQSLALVMEDPDVPKSIRPDGMWNHWIVWNMPKDTNGIKEGELPPGIVGLGTSGKASYMGPCPPDREHRYIFTLYALDNILSLPKNSTKEELIQSLNSHIIERAQLLGRYNRN